MCYNANTNYCLTGEFYAYYRKKEGCFVVKKDGKEILEPFEKIKSDNNFENFYLGVCAEKPNAVVLFSLNGEFVYKFTKDKYRASVSTLLDKIVSSNNIIQSMKVVQSLDFWTDSQVTKVFRYKHAELNKKRLEKAPDSQKLDVLYGVERNAIDRFLSIKQFLSKSKSQSVVKSKSKQTQSQVEKR